MAFALTFTTCNAAFDDAASETARILRHIANRIEQGELEGYARDANGNRVGEFILNTSEPDEESERADMIATVRAVCHGR